jgi:thiol-disulfide isomerase/thioredoxin
MNVKKCVRALLCLYLTLIIATDAVKGQSLKVGDTLPPELWSMPLQVINHPTGKETITLNEYKDKLIILDFWATWCAPCIKSLTKLDSVQKEFGEQLAVIPITYENADKVLPFLTKRGYQLPSIINDSTLKKYFPHRTIPHQVWVRAGEVLAVTGAEYATRANISKALNEEEVQMLMKEEDMEFDRRKLIEPLKSGFIESSIKGAVNISNMAYEISPHGIIYYNATLPTLIRAAYSSDFPELRLKNRLWMDSLENEISPTSKVQGGFDPKTLYTYHSQSSFSREKKAIYRRMQNDLAAFMEDNFNIRISVQKVRVPCIVVKSTSIDTENKGRSEAVGQLVNGLTHKSRLPIIDETHILGENIPYRSDNELGAFAAELQEHNLITEYTIRELEMLVVLIPKLVTP